MRARSSRVGSANRGIVLGLAMLVAAALVLLSRVEDAERILQAPPLEAPEALAAPAPPPVADEAEPEPAVVPAETRTEEPAIPTTKATPASAPAALPRWLSGRVVDASGMPLYADVEVFALTSEGRADAFATSTASDGSWESPRELVDDWIDRLPRSYRRPSQLCVWAHARGYAPERTCFEIPRTRPWSRRVDLVLDRGGGVSGRVTGERDPVEGATVRLLRYDFSELASARTDVDGGFELSFDDPGAYHVLAHAEGRGLAFAGDVALSPLMPAAIGDLVLAGEGRISGRVSYPDGVYVHGAVVEAVPLAFDLVEPMRVPYARLPRALLDGEPFRAATRTDEVGAFELNGLQPGTYALRLPDIDDPEQQPEASHATPAAGIELVLPAARLIVHVRCRERGPIELACVPLGPMPDDAREARTHRAVIDDTPWRDTWRRRARIDYEPWTSFRVDPSLDYRIDARGPQGTEAHERVSMNGWEKAIEVVLTPPSLGGEIGRVRVFVLDERGRPVDEVRVAIRKADGSTAAEHVTSRGKDAPWIDLAPGSYTIAVSATTFGFFVPNEAETALEVAVGSIHTIERRGEIGGRLWIETAGDEPEAPRASLVPAEGGAIDLELVRVEATSPIYCCDPPVPAGTYVLRVGKADLGEIEIRSGGDVTVSLDP